MRAILAGAAALVLAAFLVAPAQAQTVKYLNQLGAAGSASATDTMPVCQLAAGCGAGNALVRATVAQLNTYFQAQLSAAAPLTFSAGLIGMAACNANSVIAGPTGGVSSTPTCRALGATDMPPTPPNYQTGSYTLRASDLNNPVILKGSASASTFTLPAPGSALAPAGAVFIVADFDSNSLTIATSGGSLLGLPTNPMGQNGWAACTSDGTNWACMER